MAEQRAFCMDCMEAMRLIPDKFFDLAVVDPPYGGVKQGGYMNNTGGNKLGDKSYFDNLNIWKQQKPGPEYFKELFRVSKDQIIWGFNNFPAEIGRETQSYIVWDKKHPDGISFADCEIAWTSHDRAARIFRYKWNGMQQEHMGAKEVKIHPTQKPVELYEWIFANYAQPGMKILDTHLGSGSSRIAAHNFRLDFWGFEIDKDYFEKQEKRFAEYTAQINLFVQNID